MLAQASATSAAPSRITALLDSVRRKLRSGVCRFRTQAVCSLKPELAVPFTARPRGRASRLLKQPADGGCQAPALRCQPVLGVGGTAGNELALDDAGRLELLEALGERCRRDPRQRLTELVEARSATGAGIDRAQCPAPLEQIRYCADLGRDRVAATTPWRHRLHAPPARAPRRAPRRCSSPGGRSSARGPPRGPRRDRRGFALAGRRRSGPPHGLRAPSASGRRSGAPGPAA